MARGDSLLIARPAECRVAPGDLVELVRLPNAAFEVTAVLCRISEDYSPRYLLELDNGEQGPLYLWHDDASEMLFRLTPEPR
jgi:hypothetical protein